MAGGLNFTDPLLDVGAAGVAVGAGPPGVPIVVVGGFGMGGEGGFIEEI